MSKMNNLYSYSIPIFSLTVVDSLVVMCLTDPCWMPHPLSSLADPRHQQHDNTRQSADINTHNSQMCHLIQELKLILNFSK